MVYLIHLDQAIGNPQNRRAQARHYIGTTRNLSIRMEQHLRGRGAAMMRYVAAQGISWSIARTWEGGRAQERKVKAYKGANRLCPICKAARRQPPNQLPLGLPEWDEGLL